MNKNNINKSNKPCERVYSDISYVNTLSLGKKRYWILFVDEFTKYKWSNCVEKKEEFDTISISRLRVRLYQNIKPKYIILDNSGEKSKLKNALINNLNYPYIKNISI